MDVHNTTSTSVPSPFLVRIWHPLWHGHVQHHLSATDTSVPSLFLVQIWHPFWHGHIWHHVQHPCQKHKCFITFPWTNLTSTYTWTCTTPHPCNRHKCPFIFPCTNLTSTLSLTWMYTTPHPTSMSQTQVFQHSPLDNLIHRHSCSHIFPWTSLMLTLPWMYTSSIHVTDTSVPSLSFRQNGHPLWHTTTSTSQTQAFHHFPSDKTDIHFDTTPHPLHRHKCPLTFPTTKLTSTLTGTSTTPHPTSLSQTQPSPHSLKHTWYPLWHCHTLQHIQHPRHAHISVIAESHNASLSQWNVHGLPIMKLRAAQLYKYHMNCMVVNADEELVLQILLKEPHPKTTAVNGHYYTCTDTPSVLQWSLLVLHTYWYSILMPCNYLRTNSCVSKLWGAVTITNSNYHACTDLWLIWGGGGGGGNYHEQ